MNTLTLTALLAAALVCALPGVSSADPWCDIGPAGSAFNYSGYIDPWTGRQGNGAYDHVPYRSLISSSAHGTPRPDVTSPVPSPCPRILHPFARSSSYPQPMTEASIQVRVPANAEIWIDNNKTSQTGALRNFVSPPLENGRTFTYVVHARWTDSTGKVIDQTKLVAVQSGQWSLADFEAESAKSRERSE